MKQFRVCFVVIDSNNRARYFDAIVEAKNADVALRQAKKKAFIRRSDLVRDVQVLEVL